jgi:aspartate beta-hydroxylase
MNSSDLARLEAAATTAMQRGDRKEALARWREVLEIDKNHATALNTVGNWLLSQGDGAGAFAHLRRAVENDPGQPALLFNMAMAARASGQPQVALDALDAALVCDPYFVQAMYQKAVLLDELGKPEQAALLYRDVIKCAPPEILSSDNFKPTLDRARAAIHADGNALIETVGRMRGSKPASPRVSLAIDILAGHARAYVHEPTFLNVPQLPAVSFFDREQTPWIEALEVATPIILGELEAMLASENGSSSFTPYVANPPGTPLNQWRELDHSPAWGALHLWRHGKAIDENIARFPETAKLLHDFPRLGLKGRAPNAFFSVLKVGAHIPPHTGVTNARSTVHLGLIVPDGCKFRVGNDVRHWKQGHAWLFDDSIEHEAWNDGTADRVILIFDVWNPYFEDAEQRDIAALLEAYDDHYGEAMAWSNQ